MDDCHIRARRPSVRNLVVFNPLGKIDNFMSEGEILVCNNKRNVEKFVNTTLEGKTRASFKFKEISIDDENLLFFAENNASSLSKITLRPVHA